MTSRERREWYLSHGICPACGQNDVQCGYKLCLECRMKKKEYAAAHPATPEQLAAQRTRDHARRAERKAQGLCPRCGKHKPESGYSKCVYCRAKDAAQHRRKHAAQEGAVTTEQRLSGYYCYHCSAELPEWRENKLCDDCLKMLQTQSAEMRKHIDYAKHPFGREAHRAVERIKRRHTNGEPPRIDFITLGGKVRIDNIQRKFESIQHICPLQLDIVERLITRYSNEGDRVLDPFGGIGTVPKTAIKMGRYGIGIELNPDYFRDGVAYCKAEEGDK